MFILLQLLFSFHSLIRAYMAHYHTFMDSSHSYIVSYMAHSLRTLFTGLSLMQSREYIHKQI